MPVYTLQGPDGRTYRIEGPAGATVEQLAAVIHGQELPSARAQVENDAISRGARDPTAGMSGMQRFAAGYGKAGSDLARGVGQALGLVSRDDVAESRKLDAPLMNTGAGTAGNFLGTAAAMAPTAFIPGANTAMGGAAIGAASGLLQPSTSTGETLANAGIGGVAGAAVPLLMAAGKTAKSFIEPLYEKGREKIVGRAISDAAATDPAQLAQALRGAKSQVPGVQYTVGEAAQNPSLAALQRTATQTSPAVMNAAVARQAANNDARMAALQAIAGDRAASVSARDAATTALYQAANGKQITITPELQALLQRPVMSGGHHGGGAVAEARTLALNEGRKFSLTPPAQPQPSAILAPNGQPASSTAGRPGTLMTEDAHTIKRALDDTIEGLAGRQGLARNARRAAADTKNQFLNEIEQQVPEYGAARTTYAQMSQPVNRADVTNLLIDRATPNKATGQITPAAYARALNDRTAQSALGRTDATLAGVYSPQEMATLNAIRDDLVRQNFAQTAGKGGGSDTVQKLAYSNMMNAAGVPSAVRNFGPAGIVGNVGQRVGQAVYKDANEKLAERLARALLDPADAAALVEGGMVTPQMAALANALRRTGTAAGAALPALVQANQ